MKRTIYNVIMLAIAMLVAMSPMTALADAQAAEPTAQPQSQGFWDRAGNAIKDGYGRASDGLSSAASSAGNAIQDGYNRASDGLSSAASTAGDAIRDGYDRAAEGIGTVASSAGELLSGLGATPAPDASVEETQPTAEPTPVPTPAPTLPPNALKHFMGAVVNTGIDNGYSGSGKITSKDPHFGWTLGRFFVSGYTRVTEDANGAPVFLKTLGDTVTLWFTLEQNIDKLNGNDLLTIAEDKNGFDEYFGINKTNFGRGALIVRQVDHQNLTKEPTLYTDYLSAKVATSADTQVELFEEGDYEVALDYEIKNSWHKFNDAFSVGNVNVGRNTIDDFPNYRIFFRFSVRNGNCMVYPFDVLTKAELTNTAITENGFYLDLARSRYLDINIKKETLAAGATGLTEDTRFNRPAKDGDEYTEEGIYTISVSNRYTGQQTTKKIYVGTNDILKAHLTTGLPIQQIEEELAGGATVAEDGAIVPASN